MSFERGNGKFNINEYYNYLSIIKRNRMKHLGYMVACFVILLKVQLVNAQDDVKIGTQVWTSKNLDVSTFRNGDPIPEAKNAKEWVTASENKTAAYCYYDYDRKNGKVYGKLYNWHAVNDSRGLAPKGYHLPSDAEWTILTDMLGGEAIAGEKMKSKQGWRKNGKYGNGNNSSGFNGLPGGYCDGDGIGFGNFFGIAAYGYWWSSSEESLRNAWYRYLFYNSIRVGMGSDYEYGGLSVRCLRD